ncbi:MAG: hypothetical protein E5V27_23815 [Mesorhizobium sp.]|nr:MAG: hypothetical protein E5V27_23815 [Mesorhizobium sp.]
MTQAKESADKVFVYDGAYIIHPDDAWILESSNNYSRAAEPPGSCCGSGCNPIGPALSARGAGFICSADAPGGA